MKLTRTTTHIPRGRKNKLIILAMSINLGWKEDQNRWKAEIKEYEQRPVENPGPGAPLFSYIPLLTEAGKEYEPKYYTAQEVDALFSMFNITISPGDNFTDKFRHVIALSCIYINQVDPPYAYALNPADLEMVDTALEVAPGEPEPDPIIEE